MLKNKNENSNFRPKFACYFVTKGLSYDAGDGDEPPLTISQEWVFVLQVWGIGSIVCMTIKYFLKKLEKKKYFDADFWIYFYFLNF